MEALQSLLKSTQLHPVADHFTIALLIVGVLTDLVASLLPTREWLRRMALTLMILGAVSATASYFTGDAEADRIWDAMSQPAKDFFAHKGTVTHFFGHGMLGMELMYFFGVLALWRIGIEAFNFMAGTRSIYLGLAVIATALLIYQAKTGGELVYHYGVGTGPMAVGATPLPSASPTAAPIPPPSISRAPTPAAALPTPAPTPTPAPEMTPAPSPSAAAAEASPEAKPTSNVLVLPKTPAAHASPRPSAPEATPTGSPSAGASLFRS